MGFTLHVFVVNLFLGVQAVGHHVEPLAAHVERHAMAEVSPFSQAHAHEGVAGVHGGHEHGLVGLGARVRLHVGAPAVFVRAKQLLESVDSQLLGLIDKLAPTVVTLARVAFSVLVGELRTLNRHDGRGGVILRGNQLDVVLLAQVFLPQHRPDLGVYRLQ